MQRWMAELTLAERQENQWRKEARMAVKRYRAERRLDPDHQAPPLFNILYSNIQTLAPALYGQTPRPDIRRRHADEDPITRTVAETLERAVNWHIESVDFDEQIKNALHDALLTGRGAVRVGFKADFDVLVDPATEESFETPIQGQATLQYVPWEDLRIGPARTWAEVPWVAFRHQLTRAELKQAFPHLKSDDLTFTYAPEKWNRADDEDLRQADLFRRATVWEIWDLETRQVRFICPGYIKAPLRVMEDPLGLEGFFPIPRPMRFMRDTSSMIPMVEYGQYRDQARELDRLTGRINRIIESIRFRGIYDPTLGEDLENVLDASDGTLVPAGDGATALLAQGGLSNAIWMLPTESAAAVLAQLYGQREMVKNEVWEITGIADILRGVTQPNETARAQSIKANFASMRIQERQKEVARYCRDLIKLMAEVIAEQLPAERLTEMSGIVLPPPALKLLGSQQLRDYRIDIETDSTMMADELADRESVTTALTSVVSYLTGATPLITAGVLTPDGAMKMLLAAVRRFRLGRDVEEALDDPSKMLQSAMNPEKAQQMQQMQMHAAVQTAQTQAQLQAQATQMEAQNAQRKAQLEAMQLQLKMEQVALERQKLMVKAQEVARDQQEAVAEAHQAQAEQAEAERKTVESIEAARLAEAEQAEAERAAVQQAQAEAMRQQVLQEKTQQHAYHEDPAMVGVEPPYVRLTPEREAY
ncbi:putative ATPase with chaperone activity, ATP-binding subunit [Magnetofaba australis IT-1]|uniref:Putative ATPase with chaperone activity, ATP-binding subunit n=1 Tax=Magnetofaba australis IT-1 TaxID=1434232 RepID=A0A1Y2K3K6_9PROT|nr:putative ATPase with chaperone activity, ATP-binding subunit [Magnetofaba australis IT-1]